MYSLHSFVTFVVCVNLQLAISVIEEAKWWLFALQSKVDQNLLVTRLLLFRNNVPIYQYFYRVTQKMSHKDFKLQSVPKVRFYFSTSLLE